VLPERRSTFVLNTTISELILLLFFLVLLLLAYSYIANSRLEEEKSAAEGRASAAEQSEKELKARVDRLQVFYELVVARLPERDRSSVTDTLVAIDKLRAEIDTLGKRKSDLERDVLAHEELIRRLAQKIPTTSVPSELRKEIGDLALCKEAKTRMPEMGKRIGDLETDNRNLRQIAKDATAKAARCGGKGEEFVACWRTDDGKRVQPVFDVFLEGGLIRVVRKWPESRDTEMDRFPHERALAGRVVSLDEFMQDTQAIFAQSVRDNCRHYVQFNGERAKMNASMFTQFIRIQDHFYPIENIK